MINLKEKNSNYTEEEIKYKNMKIGIKSMDNSLYVGITRKDGTFTLSESLACEYIDLDGFNINKAKLKELVFKLAEKERKKLCKLLDGPITTEKDYKRYKNLYYQCDKIMQILIFIYKKRRENMTEFERDLMDMGVYKLEEEIPEEIKNLVIDEFPIVENGTPGTLYVTFDNARRFKCHCYPGEFVVFKEDKQLTEEEKETFEEFFNEEENDIYFN